MLELLLLLLLPIALGFLIFISNTLIDMYLGIGFFYFVYLIFTKELSHFIEKRRLIKGDLVIIKYRGKYRKAYIKDVGFHNDNKFQLEFDDRELNTKLVEHNWYPISRIIIPEYMGKVAKILFTEMERK